MAGGRDGAEIRVGEEGVALGEGRFRFVGEGGLLGMHFSVREDGMSWFEEERLSKGWEHGCWLRVRTCGGEEAGVIRVGSGY